MTLVDKAFVWCNGPGPVYLDVIDLVHQHLLPRTYIEIGVSTGRSMTRTLPGTDCIGVDPDPRPVFPVGKSTRIFNQTSDDFFAQHDLGELFAGLPLDLAFIDGMHQFEFALRDFINVERAANSDTTVLIHDCLPIDEASAQREKSTHQWTGDIWRLVLILRAWRPDLEVHVADSPPSGLGIVRNLDSSSTVLSDHYDEIVKHYFDVPYSSLDDGTMFEQLNRVPGDWPAVRDLLPRRPFRTDNLDRLKSERLRRSLGPSVSRSLKRSIKGGRPGQ
ncbi:MAG TPA: class I SAM-dependent methyltransferase [Acidimicrobiales bacterium]